MVRERQREKERERERAKELKMGNSGNFRQLRNFSFIKNPELRNSRIFFFLIFESLF